MSGGICLCVTYKEHDICKYPSDVMDYLFCHRTFPNRTHKIFLTTRTSLNLNRREDLLRLQSSLSNLEGHYSSCPLVHETYLFYSKDPRFTYGCLPLYWTWWSYHKTSHPLPMNLHFTFENSRSSPLNFYRLSFNYIIITYKINIYLPTDTLDKY